MALGPPFSVHIETKPGDLFGDTLNGLRAWLDHRKIQPSLFKSVEHGTGFEISFNSEDEAHLFEREFASMIRRSDLAA